MVRRSDVFCALFLRPPPSVKQKSGKNRVPPRPRAARFFFIWRNFSAGIQRNKENIEYERICPIVPVAPPESRRQGSMWKEEKVIHLPVEKKWISSKLFRHLSTPENTGMFCLFGGYPRFPPLYGSYC